MSDRRRAQGILAERAAEAFLRQRGYRIEGRNVRTRWGEVDLVARDGEQLVFVEVKSRRSGAASAPVESVTPAKVERLVRLGLAYVQEQAESEPSWRIDVISVLLDERGRVSEVTHLRNAVER